jgi:DNA-binding transcriptional LysR family regulator
LLRIGASTDISQYNSATFSPFPSKTTRCKSEFTNGNTEQIENALLNEIEIGIIEGQSKNKSIKYTEFLKDELVLVCKSSNLLVSLDEVTQEALKNMHFLMREQGSGTLEVIEHLLKPFNIKLSELQIEMQLGSTESIKSYLMNSDCVAFISIRTKKNKTMNWLY